jgi:hypothetical protein
MRDSKFRSNNFKRTAISVAVVAAMAAGVAQAELKTFVSTTGFSINNVVGDYDGTTVGTIGNGSDPTILCNTGNTIPGVAGNVAICPADDGNPATFEPQPIPGNEATTLYPIDSVFGFNVVPFAEAFDKERGDGAWTEGWVGNITDAGGAVIGLEFSDAETDTFLVPSGLGTWCTGLGGAAVKCDSEHFVVMESVLTCHETIPYYNADPYATDLVSAQKQILDPRDNSTVLVNCADKRLDNNLLVINSSNVDVNNKMTGEAITTKDGSFDAIDWSIAGLDPDKVLTFLEANESTVLDDIAYGDDYSVTAKDDGKALYRWGNLIKRPNDIRVYARMTVPWQWQTAAAQAANANKGYRVTKARLIINHKVTNNPNDQIRPEDMENEGAFGRKPGYDVSGNKWLSDRDCYQGNGVFIPAETVLRNGDFAIPDDTDNTFDGNPYAMSADLTDGFTNGWYTTVDREPFEWAYDTDGDGAADVSYRTPVVPAPGVLLSGPRWRLTPPKFGQDIPGLEIPNVECAPPPYQKDLIKYDVGAPVKTVINLLDWNTTDERSINGESPMVWSKGWTTNGWFNDGTVVNPDVKIVNKALKAVTVNGAPVSQGFDLSIYVKGDRKPTAIYNAELQIEWDTNPALDLTPLQ